MSRAPIIQKGLRRHPSRLRTVYAHDRGSSERSLFHLPPLPGSIFRTFPHVGYLVPLSRRSRIFSLWGSGVPPPIFELENTCPPYLLLTPRRRWTIIHSFVLYHGLSSPYNGKVSICSDKILILDLPNAFDYYNIDISSVSRLRQFADHYVSRITCGLDCLIPAWAT